jgi:hypothetical protein
MKIALSGEFEGDDRRPSFKEKRLDFPEAELADFGLDKRLVSIDFHRRILYNRCLYELAAVRWPHTHGAIFW